MEKARWNRIFGLILITVLALCNVPNVSAASTLDPVKSKVVVNAPSYTIPGKVKCPGMGGMEIVNNHLYYIKSDTSDDHDIATFSKILNFRTSPKTYHYSIHHSGGKVANIKHANGLTYYNGNFYIVTNKDPGTGAQIVAVDARGEITQIIKGPKKVTSISYYKDGKFIVGADQTTDKKAQGIRQFYLMTITNNQMVYNESFTVKVDSNFVGQDVTYKDGKLYVPMFDDERPATIYKNRIYTADLSSGISEGKQFPSVRTMVLNGSSSSSLFEVEGIDLDADGKKYICTNEASDQDRIRQLYK